MSADVEKGTARVAAAINSVRGGVDFDDRYSNSILVACYTPPRKSANDSHTPAITGKAKRLQRDGKVEDNLLKRNEEYKARLDILRRGREMEELLRSRTPETTTVSKNLQLKEVAHIRLYQDARSRTDNLIKLKQSLAPIDPPNQSTPSINTYSKDITRTTQHLLDWKQRKEAKIQRHRQEKAAQEVTENKPIPQVNDMSKKIVEGSRSYPVEHLLLRDHEKRVRQQKRQQAREKEAAASATPRSNSSHRRSLSSSALERLIEISTPTVKLNTQPDILTDPETGQVLFTPLVNKKNTKSASTDIWKRLMEEGHRQEFRKQRAKDMSMMDETNKLRSSPSLGAYTNVLAEVRRQREGGVDRLQQPTHHIKSNATISSVRSSQHNNTFTPRVSENSQRIDKETGRCNSRDGRYLKKEQIRSQHMAVRDQLPPTPKSHQNVNKSVVRSASAGSGNEMFVRQQNWKFRKQNRLTIQRQQQDRNEKDSCTFTPHINTYTPPAEATEYVPPSNRTEKESYATAKGAAWFSEIQSIRKQHRNQSNINNNTDIVEFLPVECP